MKITHVLRGEEHITNTPKQIMVYNSFGWEVPLFGHMTLIVNEQRQKLSKRDHSIVQFISQYRDLGYLPEALFNFITLLGWSPAINQEILSKTEVIELFEASRLSKSPSMFDQDKLKFINHTYLKNLTLEEFIKLIKPFLVAAKISIQDEKWLTDFASLLQDRCEFGAQIVELYNEFFTEDFIIEKKALDFLTEQENVLKTIKHFSKLLAETDFSPKMIFEAIKQTGKQLNVRGKIYICQQE